MWSCFWNTEDKIVEDHNLHHKYCRNSKEIGRVGSWDRRRWLLEAFPSCMMALQTSCRPVALCALLGWWERGGGIGPEGLRGQRSALWSACWPPAAGVPFGCAISPNPSTHPRGEKGCGEERFSYTASLLSSPWGSGASVSTRLLCPAPEWILHMKAE